MSLLSAVLVAFGLIQVATVDRFKAPPKGTQIVVPDEKDINTQPWWHNCP